MANFLDGQSDDAAIDLHSAYTALYIDVPQSGWYDAGTPIFDGSIDWHSSVHAHLATILDLIESGDIAGLSDFVATRYPAADVQQEADANVNDPYGWAWLLKLDGTLRDQGFDDLSVAGDAYALRLETHLDLRAANGTLDNGAGSYGDSYWMIANLYDWAQTTGDAALETRALDLFDQAVSDSNITAGTAISAGDFFSQVGIAAYAHVVVGATDTPSFAMLEQTMADAASDGTLDALLDAQGAALSSGVGYAHSPGITVSLSYGYWALFTVTQDPVHYAAFEQIVDWTETHAEALGGSIGPGHWLPNFAAFGASLPADIEVPETEELVASLQAFGLDVPPNGSGEDTLTGGGGDDTLDAEIDSYALEGADAHLFVMDSASGEIAYQGWFTPDPDDAWDQNEDHVYEVTRVGLDASGQEVTREPLELTVGSNGASWNTGDETDGSGGTGTNTGDGGGETEGLSYSLSGPDAALFTVDPATGTPSPQDWFTPSINDAWDQDADHVYDVTVTATSADGTTTTTDWQMVVTADGATLSEVDPSAPPTDGGGGSGGETGSVYTLEGPDAFLFDVDGQGSVQPKDWFTPDASDPWDQGEDNIYNLVLVETASDGAELSRTDIAYEAQSDGTLLPLLSGTEVMGLLSLDTEGLPEDMPDAPEDGLVDSEVV